jgi:hypothetical protein
MRSRIDMDKGNAEQDKKFSWISWSPYIVFACAVALLLIYIDKFGTLGKAEKPDAWGQFGDYIGGLLNPLVSTFILVVAVAVWRLQKKEMAAMKQAMDNQTKLDMGLRLIEQTRGFVEKFSWNGSPQGRDSISLAIEGLASILNSGTWFDPSIEPSSQYDRLIVETNYYAALEPFAFSVLHVLSYQQLIDKQLEDADTAGFSLTRLAMDILGTSGALLALSTGVVRSNDPTVRRSCKLLFAYLDKRTKALAMDQNAIKFWNTFRETFAARCGVE